MTREEAIKIVKSNWPEGRHQIKEALQTLIPELAESEDERIREQIEQALIEHDWSETYKVSKDDCLVYLKKQKENPKTANSISSNCVSDAKSEIPDDYPIGFPFDSEVMNVMCDVAQGDRDWKNQKDVKFYSDRLLAIVYDAIGKQKEQRLAFTWRRVEDVTTKRTDEGDCVTTEKILVKGLIDDEDYRIIDKDVMVNKNLLCIPVRELNAEQKPVHTAKEMWKEMRLEVYAQASGNRHEPNYSDDSTKMFSLCDIDEIFEKIGNSIVGSQPAEWSEEDELMRSACIAFIQDEKFKGYERAYECVDWLKSLRPQSKAELDAVAEKEAYKDGFLTARNTLSNVFMQYLDERRPEGKMCLSNGECKDITKAFEVGDWAKIIRYVNKYQPHWKPSEEQMIALRQAISGCSYDIEPLVEIHEHLKKLRER